MSDVAIPAELPEDEGEQPTDQAEVQIWTTKDDQPEEPTEGAWVNLKIEKLGAEVGMQVPSEHAGELISISPLMLGMLISVAGPILLLESIADLEMPWGAKFALAVILAVIPIAYVLLRNRRDEA
ncbi:hypothetical protein [Streptomyces sp. AC555_RSS877]|uniref:hypothetical protein n=1 Tax=Streptomyces sp. AC555_RSS877 TaxID=2823688 RepID=UPI001C25AFFF|nr:hypothetical protein [Streptomyces sp. AC555_RSS877]